MGSLGRIARANAFEVMFPVMFLNGHVTAAVKYV